VLQALGTSGTIVDLESAVDATDPAAATAVPEVWARGDTPAEVLAGLRAAGVTVIRDDTRGTALAAYRDQVPETVRRLSLALAAIGVALAVIALLLAATVERGPRGAELAALRAQGVTTTAVRRTIAAGYLVLCGGAVAVGLLGALIAIAVRAGPPKIFSDGWAVLPPPGAYGPVGWLVTVLVCAVPVGIAGVVAAARLVRAVGRQRLAVMS
jgi:hypothetical protein